MWKFSRVSKLAVRYLTAMLVLAAAIVGTRFLARVETPATPAPPVTESPPAGKKPDDTPVQSDKRKPSVVASTALPPAEAPLMDIYADLQARANRGDAIAAARLYRDLNHCAISRRLGWENTQFPTDLASANIETMKPWELDGYAMQLDAARAWDETVKLLKSSCAGVDDATLANLASSIARAAQLGDADARACYLARGPGLDSRGFLAHPEQVEAYRSNASALIDAGIAAGDWKTVDLLRQAYAPEAPGMLASLLGTDSAKQYRYLKLLRMGQSADANASRVERIDQQLAASVEGLTPAQLADADAWVQETWQKHYAAAPPATSTEAWEPCAFPL